MPAMDLKAFEFHLGIVDWDGEFLGSQPVKDRLNFQNKFYEVLLSILETE